MRGTRFANPSNRFFPPGGQQFDLALSHPPHRYLPSPPLPSQDVAQTQSPQKIILTALAWSCVCGKCVCAYVRTFPRSCVRARVCVRMLACAWLRACSAVRQHPGKRELGWHGGRTTCNEPICIGFLCSKCAAHFANPNKQLLALGGSQCDPAHSLAHPAPRQFMK